MIVSALLFEEADRIYAADFILHIVANGASKYLFYIN